MKIKPYLKRFKQSDMLIIIEYTGVYHLKLANYLYENGYKVAVVNPFSIKKFMEAKMTRVKTDKADSFFIAEYGRTFFDGEFYKPKTDYNAKKSKRIIKPCANEKKRKRI
jgi:transposase